ncbi:MAG TPA: matrixin family metalloprotease [Pyrinomonadaceae bacterium]|nr:matrixin family metalloprotease [Pyrinomonadaceae bacterium]
MRLPATLLVAAALLCGLAPPPARAYTLQLNSTATVQFRWPTTTVTIALSASLNSPPANIKAGSDVVGAARRALQRWAEAGNISFNVVASTETRVQQDGVSLITVSPTSGVTFTNPGQTGRARVFFDAATGAISEGDVAVNPATQFSTDGTPDTFDLETTFAHEIGHVLGLEHSGLAGALMQPRQTRNGTFDLAAIRRRVLSDDDRAGLRAIYGPLSGLGELRGTVRNAAGGPVFGAHVVAEDAETGRAFAANVTLSDGTYSIRALVPGQYRVVVETMNEPVLASEIPTRTGTAYAGLQGTLPDFRTFERTAPVNVNENAATTLNVNVDSQQPFLNPRYVGVNSQLTTSAAPVVPGSTFNLLVGGENLHTVGAGGVQITSPYFTVNQSSFQQLTFQGPNGLVQVLSFDVTASLVAAPGEYSVRLVSGAGEVAYYTSGLTVDLPNGVTGGQNLIDRTQFFVAQHYRDFLNREPDAGGLAFWSNAIEQCGVDAQCREVERINVSAAFFLSIEFQETGYLVYRAHQAAFGTGERLRFNAFLRDTQAVGRGVEVGLGDWQARLEANKAAFFGEFVSRPEFLALYPLTLSPAQFVDALSANTGGSLSPAERDALVADLAAGRRTRAQVLRAVAEDADFHAREFNKAFVLMQYFGYLRRNPDDTDFRGIPDPNFEGFNFWLQKLNQFGGDFRAAEMVRAFLNSIEYRARFGPT